MSWRRGNRPNKQRWDTVRLLVLDRDAWTCTACGKAGRLEVDHRIPLEDAPDRMYDLTNLQTLCRGCHILKHGGRGPSPEVQEWRRYLTSYLP